MLALGRIVFAIATIGFGVVALIYGDFTHNLQPVELIVPRTMPGYDPLARLSALFLLVAGVLLLIDYRTRLVATALAAFLASWVLFLQIPSAFRYPQLLRSPWWVRTFEVVAMCGAAWVLAGFASGAPDGGRRVLQGRLLFGASLPVFGVLHLIYGPATATLIPGYYPFPLFLAYFTGAAKLVAGVAIVSGRLVRVAAMLTAFQYTIYVLTLHLPRQFVGRAPAAQRAGSTSLFVAIAFVGAALIVAGTISARRRAPEQ